MKYVKKHKPALWLRGRTGASYRRKASLRLKRTKSRIKAARGQITRIIVRSKKRANEEAKYRRRVKVWIIGKYCECCFQTYASECHHSRSRIGSLLLNEKYWIALCSKCHRFVHENPSWARTRGLLCEKGKWGLT